MITFLIISQPGIPEVIQLLQNDQRADDYDNRNAKLEYDQRLTQPDPATGRFEISFENTYRLEGSDGQRGIRSCNERDREQGNHAID